MTLKILLKQFALQISTDLHETVYASNTTDENNEEGKSWTIENQFRNGKWNESFNNTKNCARN